MFNHQNSWIWQVDDNHTIGGDTILYKFGIVLRYEPGFPLSTNNYNGF